MFDIGWQELLVIAIVTVVVVGPKELPRVLRTVTTAIRKIRSMASDFQDSLEELARESELAEIKRDLERTAEIDFEKELEDTLDPTREVEQSVRELESAVAGTGEERSDPTIEAPKIEAAEPTGQTAAPEEATVTEVADSEVAAAEAPAEEKSAETVETRPADPAGASASRSGTSG